ncbi:MAG: hypothetical protein H6738_23820 [Alphaproteobacteria bacterium]|nr:hypothetical protein [Alphaproteobacteria bacterium]
MMRSLRSRARSLRSLGTLASLARHARFARSAPHVHATFDLFGTVDQATRLRLAHSEDSMSTTTTLN